MMIVPIKKRVRVLNRESLLKTLPTVCDASIPLSFIKNISSGTIKRLAEGLQILTLEDLHLASEPDIRDHIPNRKMLQEIFNLRNQIKKMVTMAKYRNILLFEKKAQGSNIKIRPNQRAKLIGVVLFANICKDPLEVVSYALSIETEIFRQQALIKKLVGITNQIVHKAS